MLCVIPGVIAELVNYIWQDLGIAVLETAIKACAKEIEKHKGKLLVKEAPRAVLSLFFLYIWACLCVCSFCDERCLHVTS